MKTGGREWRYARERWEFWNLKKKKKIVSWDLNSEQESWDLGLDDASRLSELAEARPVVCGEGHTW